MTEPIPSPVLARYSAFGHAIPEQGGWWFDRQSLQGADASGNVLLDFSAEMRGGRFHATLGIADVDELEDIVDVKQYIQSNVQTVADVIGLFHGAAIDCEVLQLVRPSGDVVVFDSSFGGIELSQSAEDFQHVTLASFVRRGIRLGLADFRLGIKVPIDTAFLAFRGIESVRDDFRGAEDRSDAASWSRLRDATGVSRAEIDAIKSFADPRRHGRAIPLTHADRKQSLLLLRKVILSAVSWAASNDPALRELIERRSTTVKPDSDASG